MTLQNEFNKAENMKKIQLLLIALLIVKTGISQTSTQSFEIQGNSYEYEQLNEVENPEALLVLFNGGAGKASKIIPETSLPDSAVGYKFKTIGIDQPDFFLSDSTYLRIRSIIKYVMKKEGIKQNLFIGGFSLGGYTTIRFSEMATEKNDTLMIPNAIFAIDPPLDHLDFVDYCLRELNRQCPNEAANKLGKAEANWILNYYEQNFGSYIDDSTVYIEHSCFTATQSDGGNGKYLKNIPLNMIHEIDIMWLIKERCRDLSDANAVISSKFINFLIGLGNKEATITLTSDKGYRADGRRHPHSWSIAEPIPTLDWLSGYLIEEK
jgi:hypothetical protein